MDEYYHDPLPDPTWFDKMTQRDKLVFFGHYDQFDQFRYRPSNDTLSLYSSTLVPSEDTTTLSGTTDVMPAYQEHEGPESQWIPGSPSEELSNEDSVLTTLTLVIRDFGKSTIGSPVRSSPHYSAHLAPEDFDPPVLAEEGEEIEGNDKMAVANLESPLDAASRERVEKLKSSIEVHLNILESPRPDAGNGQAKGQPSPANSGSERDDPVVKAEEQNTDRYLSAICIPIRHQKSKTPQQRKKVLQQNTPRALPDLKPRGHAHKPGAISNVAEPRRSPKRNPIPRPGNGRFSCSIDGCSERFTRPENRRRHIRTFHRQAETAAPLNNPLECPVCKAIRSGGRALENMNSHLRRQHSIYINYFELLREQQNHSPYTELPESIYTYLGP
ncbi:hypothetical protein TWF730_004527 [Orbilia blumenaviensis]|uniref:C2H2-type domain-containing protein n=1 Tax=Orbilia blumenaviensis TaxID=1796055 RepID=A0AAV9TYQ0_9PEZI